jgi:formylglycine-generating enzyme required for sulfatase activity
VSWNDAVKFAEWLNGRDGRAYRLPTEAEWEYACRGGRPSSQPFGIGDGQSLSSRDANFDGNSPYGSAAKDRYLGKTASIGSYPANAFGLFDMHGNVWEWCSDWYDEYPSDRVTDPMGPTSGSARVIRGGGWGLDAWSCRAAFRTRFEPGFRHVSLGFRLAHSSAR